MEEQPKHMDNIRDLLKYSIEDLQNVSTKSVDEFTSFLANAIKRKGLISNRIRDGAFCLNQVNHEINANNILVSELQETAKEEEKKLAEYPERMAEIDQEMEEIWKNIELCLREKEALKPQTCIIKKKWEDKLNALSEVLGFNTDAKAHNIFMQYEDIDMDTLNNRKESVSLLLKEGSYEVSETSTQVESFENHVRKLNRGMPFPSFCCELKKSVEDNE